MKKTILTLLAASVIIISCNNGKHAYKDLDSAETAAVIAAHAPIIKFETDHYDFGTINQGDKVTREFKFTNTGKIPLIISDATATCGCTIPEYPKEPVAPGANGVIKVVFNSAGKVGEQHKVVTITSNANPTTSEVFLVGTVNVPENNDQKTK